MNFTNFQLKMIKPLSNHIFIEAVEEAKTTESGIVLPETSGEKPVKGKIVFAGPGKKNDKGEIMPMSVKVGDTVLFKKYGPEEVEISAEGGSAPGGEGKKYLVGTEDDILAILE